jgi:hypothetical protein
MKTTELLYTCVESLWKKAADKEFLIKMAEVLWMRKDIPDTCYRIIIILLSTRRYLNDCWSCPKTVRLPTF